MTDVVEIDFEIDGGDGPTTEEVFAAIQQQLADPFSALRRSEFGQYCAQASVYEVSSNPVATSGKALGLQQAGGATIVPGSVQDQSAATAGFNGGAATLVQQFPPGVGRAEVGGASSSTAPGRGVVQHLLPSVPAAPQSDVPAREILALEEKHRQEVHRLEMLLRDRENISAHAKEMWLAESSRAAKLGETLERAEKRINELEKNLSQLSLMYNDASQELRQLKHIFGNTNKDVASPGYAKSMPTQSRGRLPQSPGKSQLLSPSVRGLNSTMAALSAPGDQHSTDDAVLYEDDLIQVGIKARYREMEAEVTLYYGNKNTKTAFHNFSTEYSVKEDTLLRISSATAPATVEAGTQQVQRVSAVCTGPFTEQPILRLSFLLSDNSPRRIQVKLPISVAKFLDPLELSSTDFFAVWRDADCTVNEETAVVDVGKKWQDAATLAPLARAVCLRDVLKLLPGVDSNPDNLVLAGQFSAAGGARHVALCRVEIGSGAFRGKARIALRSTSQKLSKGLSLVLQNLVSGGVGDQLAR
ncbi:unnamed protein product [Amoebophrya sp. A25]|nr:unnamed protein product [Amoebophrya sp. A25]|eukprot:GSA25T00015998001.1